MPAVLRVLPRGLDIFITVLCGLLFYSWHMSVCAGSESAAVFDDGPGVVPREADPGVTYSAGTRLRIPGTDWSFVVPERWQSSRPEDSEMPFLIAQEGKGLGMIFPLAEMTRETVRDQLNQPLSLLHGLSFIPAGSVVETDTSLARSYQNEDMTGRALAAFGPGHRSVMYFIMGPRGEASLFEAVLEDLKMSTRFGDSVSGHETGL